MNDQRVWHPSSAGQIRRPVVWRFEGASEMTWMTAACGAGILLFRLCYGGWNLPFVPSLGMGGVPPLAVGTFVLRLVSGKPAHYAAEFIEWRFSQLRMGLWRRGLPVKVVPLFEKPGRAAEGEEGR